MAKIKIDFTGVESFQKCEAGEHVVKIKKAVSEIAKSSGADMIKVTFEVVKGNSEGARLFDNFVLSEKALWRLKGFLEMIGMGAEGKVSLDLDKLAGRMCIVNVKMEEYNGEDRPKIADYKKLNTEEEEEEDVFDEQEEEETPPPAKEKKKSKKEPEPEPEDDDDDGPVIYENDDGTFELEDGTPCDGDGNPIKKKEKAKKKKEPEPVDDWGDDGDTGWDD